MAASAAPEHFDAIVVGAGFAGLYQLYSLRKMGLTAHVLEAGEGIGGTWFWNRYPVPVATSKASTTPIRSAMNCSRNGLVRALRPAGRDHRVHQFRGGQVRPAQGNPAVRARRQRGVRRDDEHLDHHHRARRAVHLPVRREGHGLPVDSAGAQVQGLGELQGQLVSQRRLAARSCSAIKSPESRPRCRKPQPERVAPLRFHLHAQAALLDDGGPTSRQVPAVPWPSWRVAPYRLAAAP